MGGGVYGCVLVCVWVCMGVGWDGGERHDGVWVDAV